MKSYQSSSDAENSSKVLHRTISRYSLYSAYFQVYHECGVKVLISKLNAVSAELIKIELWNKSIKR
jgi:hypothetical protein